MLRRRLPPGRYGVQTQAILKTMSPLQPPQHVRPWWSVRTFSSLH